MTKKDVTYFATILAILLFGAIVLPDRCTKPQEPVIVTKTKEVIKEVQADTTRFKKSIDSLTKNEQKLKVSLTESKKKLHNANAMMQDFLDNSTVIIDSSSKDELKLMVANLTMVINAQDSACNEVIAGQDSIIMNQAEQLFYKDSLAASFERAFNQVVINNQAKEKYIKQLKKQVKQKKFGNVVWKIAAGAAGVVILKNALK